MDSQHSEKQISCLKNSVTKTESNSRDACIRAIHAIQCNMSMCNNVPDKASMFIEQCWTQLDIFRVPSWVSLYGRKGPLLGLTLPDWQPLSTIVHFPAQPALKADSCCSTVLFWPPAGIDTRCIGEFPLHWASHCSWVRCAHCRCELYNVQCTM